MLRLLFPRIDFAGRIGRGMFWRELVVTALTAPVILGFLSYIFIEFSAAAAAGLSVDHARPKALAGFALALVGLRNTIAFWSVVKRRMNDIGYNGADFWRDSRPLAIVVVLLIVLALTLPVLGHTAILIVPIIWLCLWQMKKVVTFACRLLATPSIDSEEALQLAQARAAPAPARRLDLKIRHWLGEDISDTGLRKITRALQSEFNQFSDEVKRSKTLAELKTAPTQYNLLNQLQHWLNQPVVAAQGTGRMDRSDRGTAPSRQPKLRPPQREKVAYKSPVTNAVRVARSQPRHGRSTFWSGLIRGPWG